MESEDDLEEEDEAEFEIQKKKPSAPPLGNDEQYEKGMKKMDYFFRGGVSVADIQDQQIAWTFFKSFNFMSNENKHIVYNVWKNARNMKAYE